MPKRLKPILLGMSDHTDANITSSLKRVLIIYSETMESAQFLQVVEEKLMCFLQPPYHIGNGKQFSHQSGQSWYFPTLSNQFILKTLEKIAIGDLDQLPESKIRAILKEFDLLFFTLKCGSLYDEWKTSKITEIIRALVDREKIALVFGASAASARLGYLKSNTFRGGMKFNVKLLKSLKRRELFDEFLSKYSKTSKSKKALYFGENMASTLVKKSESSNIDDWLWLGQHEEKDEYSLVLHKTKKILYQPFYGFKHGNNCLHDLVFYSVKYLLFDHLKPSPYYGNRLLLKCVKNQLSDIDIINC